MIQKRCMDGVACLFNRFRIILDNSILACAINQLYTRIISTFDVALFER